MAKQFTPQRIPAALLEAHREGLTPATVWEGEQMGAYYAGRRATVLGAVREYLRNMAAVATCATVGHAIEDHSYGNPETGCVDLQCTRCGWSHHVTLY